MPVEIVSTMEKITISTFGQGRHPVCLQTSATVKEALKTFATEKVLSFPIANSTQKASIHGFLDLFDILAYLLDLWDENVAQEAGGLKKLGETFLNKSVSDLIDKSDNDTFAAVTGDERADRLIRLFGLGVHRVAQLDMNGGLANVLSQSDVVKYLNSNLQLLGDNAQKSLKELKMIETEKMVVADIEQTAVSAFQILAQNLISAVPLVDKSGVLCGTLSVSDLKLIHDDLSPLQMTTKQYKSIQDPIPSVVCTPATTLGEVIALLANSNVHRVWVVDEAMKPLSVISITNVCEFLTQFLPKEDD